ncbi:MAG: trigger factor [Vicinamibacterales bacterium]
MKTELVDVNETLKNLTIEIPSDLVDTEIEKTARTYARQARLPGFRPGKVPTKVAKKRFLAQILQDVTQALVPRAVEDALQERGIEPVDTPDIRDVTVEEGRPLTFTAAVETVPPIDPGDLSSIEVRRPADAVTDEGVTQTLEGLRQRAARSEAVEGRPVAEGDMVVVDLERRETDGSTDRHEATSIQVGGPANPPGFDAHLIGMETGATKTFDLPFPDAYPVPELAGSTVTYTITLKEIRRQVLPELDDEFAKDLGEFDSLDALRTRVRADMEEEARASADRDVRAQLLTQLASRVGFTLPTSLVERELDRRLEEFVRQLVSQQIDPRSAGIDWPQFRESQRESATIAVASALVLDEVARREAVMVSPEDVDKEIDLWAERTGRTAAVVRAQLEKDGGMSRLYTGLRREKAVDLALSRAKIAGE